MVAYHNVHCAVFRAELCMHIEDLILKLTTHIIIQTSCLTPDLSTFQKSCENCACGKEFETSLSQLCTILTLNIITV